MTDIRCSFKAFVDYDVYFDESIRDKQTGDQILWENPCVHHDCVQIILIIQTEANREAERERERETDRERDREPRRVSCVLE